MVGHVGLTVRVAPNMLNRGLVCHSSITTHSNSITASFQRPAGSLQLTTPARHVQRMTHPLAACRLPLAALLHPQRPTRGHDAREQAHAEHHRRGREGTGRSGAC